MILQIREYYISRHIMLGFKRICMLEHIKYLYLYLLYLFAYNEEPLRIFKREEKTE